MPTKIKCPGCQYEFPLEDALTDELKNVIEKQKDQLRLQMQEYNKKREEEVAAFKKSAEMEALRKEQEWQQKLYAERQTPAKTTGRAVEKKYF